MLVAGIFLLEALMYSYNSPRPFYENHCKTKLLTSEMGPGFSVLHLPSNKHALGNRGANSAHQTGAPGAQGEGRALRGSPSGREKEVCGPWAVLVSGPSVPGKEASSPCFGPDRIGPDGGVGSARARFSDGQVWGAAALPRVLLKGTVPVRVALG